VDGFASYTHGREGGGDGLMDGLFVRDEEEEVAQ